MNNTISKRTLFDNFSGKATPLQKKMIESWLEDSSNLEFYYSCLDEWENQNLQFIADEKAAFNKIMSAESDFKIGSNKFSNQSFIYRVFASKYAVIASIVFILAVSGVYIFEDSLMNKTIHTAFGETQRVILPDGSLVTLNANSTLRYARFGFGVKNRTVHLNGEADFSVKHTFDNKQFLVYTDNNITITVLGTEFTAYARETARVVLKSGKIVLNYKEKSFSKSLIMKPGDLFENKNNTNYLKHTNRPEIFSCWKKQEFVFDNTSLRDIASMCKDNYGLTFIFESNELAERRISGSFHAENENELLEVLSILLEINYKYKKEKSIYFFD